MPEDFANAEYEYEPAVEELRSNVALILERGDGNIFVGERVDRNDAWQFPQGGVDAGESLADALCREVKEEIGLTPQTYEIIERRGGYRYTFPAGHGRGDHYKGQQQTYFRCRFLGNDGDVDVNTSHPEFSRYQWIAPQDFNINWLPEFKRRVYIRVLADFYGVSISSS